METASIVKRSEFKGWFHFALTIAALAELYTSKSKVRTVLIAAAGGWHAYATWDHFVNEPKELNEKD